MLTDRRKDRFLEVIAKRQKDFTIVIENIWDPHNVSAILRSADAVGIETVHLLYTIEEAPNFKRVGKKSSSSASKWLEFVYHDDEEGCISSLKKEGFSVFASHLTKHSMSLHELKGTGKIALIFGNESRGVSETALELADGAFYIPMVGMIESLNASVAAAVSMYEIMRQRLAAGTLEHSQHSDEEASNKLEAWARK
ncbi:MAG: RNA methyltransferase [Ectothiorhodospiraceae bacterium]|nr:RNA methyltransferase [Ectothiorhodospiraceae bacterium]